MGLFNTLRYSSKASELTEVIELLWVKLKSYYDKHFAYKRVNDFEANRLGLYDEVPTGDTQKIIEYMDKLPKWSNILNYRRHLTHIIICNEGDLNTFLQMNREFSSNLNTYLSLVKKMDDVVPGNIRNIIKEYNEIIEDIRYLKIFRHNPL